MHYGVFLSKQQQHKERCDKELLHSLKESRRRIFRRAMLENPHNPRNYKKSDQLEINGQEINWRWLVTRLLNQNLHINKTFCLRSYLFIYSRWEFNERSHYFHPLGYPDYSASFLQELLAPYFSTDSTRFSFEMLVLSNLRLPLGQINKEYRLSRFIVERLEQCVLDPCYSPYT